LQALLDKNSARTLKELDEALNVDKSFVYAIGCNRKDLKKRQVGSI